MSKQNKNNGKKRAGGKPSPVRRTFKKRGGIRTQLYTSAKGTQVEFSPMPPMLLARIEEQVDKEFGEIEPPTYESDGLAGKQVHPHTESSLETDEDKAAWAVYEERTAERGERISSLTLRALQIECMRPIIDDDDDWLERLEFIGFDIPDNKFDQQLLWVESQFVGHADDIMACMQIPMELAGVSQEDMAAAETMFHDTVQEETA